MKSEMEIRKLQLTLENLRTKEDINGQFILDVKLDVLRWILE